MEIAPSRALCKIRWENAKEIAQFRLFLRFCLLLLSLCACVCVCQSCFVLIIVMQRGVNTKYTLYDFLALLRFNSNTVAPFFLRGFSSRWYPFTCMYVAIRVYVCSSSFSESALWLCVHCSIAGSFSL